MSICTVNDCNRPIHGNGLCNAHSQRLLKHGDVRAHVPIQQRSSDPLCTVEDCGKKRVAHGLCSSHNWRMKKYGSTELPEKPKKAPTRRVTKFGYRVVYIPDHPMANSAGTVAEHRLVMAQSLGRNLRDDENVHHINGDRLDNRLDNLELWSKSQPAGQRIEDKVAWAVEMISLYRPDLLAS